MRGYAKNNPDGTVEILIQGPKQNVDQFIDWARIGPPTARVLAVKINQVEEEPQAGFRMV